MGTSGGIIISCILAGDRNSIRPRKIRGEFENRIRLSQWSGTKTRPPSAAYADWQVFCAKLRRETQYRLYFLVDLAGKMKKLGACLVFALVIFDFLCWHCENVNFSSHPCVVRNILAPILLTDISNSILSFNNSSKFLIEKIGLANFFAFMFNRLPYFYLFTDQVH